MKKKTAFAWIGAGAVAITSLVIGYEVRHHQHYDLSNVGKCDCCILHLKHRTAVSWVFHLMEDHGCSEDDAYTTIDRLYMKIHKD